MTRQATAEVAQAAEQREAHLREHLSQSLLLQQLYGHNYMDNYGYREVSIVTLLQQNGYPDIVHMGGRVGADARSARWDKIAIKTCQTTNKSLRYRTGFGEFSRQHTPKARADARLVGYQAIAYGIFRRYEYPSILLMFIRGRAALAKHAAIIEHYQRRFDALPAERIAQRDSIRVPLFALYNALEPGVDYDLFFCNKPVADPAAFLAAITRPRGIMLPPIECRVDQK